MNPGARSFLIELESILDIIIGDSKSVLLFFRVIDFGNHKFVYHKIVDGFGCVFGAKDAQGVTIARYVACSALAGGIIALDGCAFGLKVDSHFATGKAAYDAVKEGHSGLFIHHLERQFLELR